MVARMVGCGFNPLIVLTVLTILRISNCEDYMKKFRVVPDLIDKSPPVTLKVVYECNVKVEEGNELTPTQVKHQPIAKWPLEDGIYYVLILVDLDGPSPQHPINREWQHWLVGNIPDNDISKEEILSEYIGAGPPKTCGLHRYVFLLYKQLKELRFSEKRLNNTSSVGRERFSSRNFAKKYDLGEPVAGNLFLSKWDSYVPILQRQIRFPSNFTCPP